MLAQMGGFKFAGVADILERIGRARASNGFLQAPDLEGAELLYEPPVYWIARHYVILVPVQNVEFMQENIWYPGHAKALAEGVMQGWNPMLEVPAARVYVVTPEKVEDTQRHFRQGDLQDQYNMIEPWQPSDVGSYYVTILDGNHRVAAAMLSGSQAVVCHVAEDYRARVSPSDWLT